MRTVHIILPFSRPENKDKLIEAYRPMDIVLHPIMFVDEETGFNEPWISPFIIAENATDCKANMPGVYKRNKWIEGNFISDEDYYLTADDDDFYETNVFDEIRQMDDDIVIISMKRGKNIPKEAGIVRSYPTTTLVAKPENVQIGMISSQQSFVKGKIFKAHTFNDTWHCGDGEIAVHHKDDGEQIAYRPDLYALFNYFEPGRWEGTKISFGCITNDAYRLNTVLKKSDLPGELHFIINPESATKGLNKLLDVMDQEGADIAILVHQDMYFRNGWLEKVRAQLELLPDDWWVAGIIGKDLEGRMCGRLHDMRIVDNIDSSEIHTFPQPACCFDECCLIINMKRGFRFDEELDGFDMYGTMCVLQAWENQGGAYIIDAFAEHYCSRSFGWFPDEDFKRRYKWLYNRYNERFGTVDSTVFVSKPRFETSAAPDAA